MKKRLQNKITKKLTELNDILEEISNSQIEIEDTEMWDADYYYDLAEQLKAALALLEDKKLCHQLDEFGNPLIEAGICSLLDKYTSEEEEEND